MTEPTRHTTRVLSLDRLAPRAWEMTLERAGMPFRAGEEITVHGPPALGDRTYSILSGEGEEHLRILFRVVPGGALSPWLAERGPGDALAFTGPHGNFRLRDPARRIVFIATGTGIAPAVSFVRTHQGLDLTLVHGIRTAEDQFHREDFDGRGYAACVSREQPEGRFHGRVTDWLGGHVIVHGETDYYLCGSNAMITDVRSLLIDQGADPERIFAEPYYFW